MSIEELNKSWVLFKSVQDKERFDKLSLEDKLEALRIVAIQTKTKRGSTNSATKPEEN